MAKIAKKGTPSKVYKKLIKLVPSFKDAPLSLRQLFCNHTPYQLYEALDYYHSSIDFQKNNLELTIKVHQKVCYLKDCFLKIHLIVKGWIIEDKDYLSRIIDDIQEEAKDKDSALIINHFLRFNTDYDCYAYDPIFEMQATFFKVAFHNS